ncbi:Nicotinamidase-related amidase [Formivibrio citricus]|uniref:Nicotinamidase-related amidase n=1 Tax=Formivibrio citricus TaxID=83765 RepID=A0A1I5D6G4_9NEIS|nr:cysteine hydrolase [Formivibrio citricus]SFN94825.1 Nicotinamidase-related amidase [Formivibrio citricus]
MSNRKTHLLVIDPQNDFCDQPDDYLPQTGERLAPALPVQGAHADMLRVATLIERCGQRIDAITVTLDSHQRIDIAHPTFWQQGDGTAVQPFTPITAADVREGRFVPRQTEALPRVLAYLDALEAAGRYTHMVWPVHCEIGSWGHNVHADVRAAYNRWEETTSVSVGKVLKGLNPWTEHYSAIRAEVPDSRDEGTQLNRALIAQLKAADQVLIAGEAGSHCVKATTEHIAEAFDPADLPRLVLLTDCMSPVTGFESQYQGFIDDMRAKGLRIATSTEIMAELLAGNGA